MKPGLKSYESAIVLALVCCVLATVVVANRCEEKGEIQGDFPTEMSGDSEFIYQDDPKYDYVPPGDLPDTSDIAPIRFAVEATTAKIAAMASDDLATIHFYFEGEEVGIMSWKDSDGDGELELTWEGISVEKSGQALIEWLKQSGRVCTCPQKGASMVD